MYLMTLLSLLLSVSAFAGSKKTVYIVYNTFTDDSDAGIKLLYKVSVDEELEHSCYLNIKANFPSEDDPSIVETAERNYTIGFAKSEIAYLSEVSFTDQNRNSYISTGIAYNLETLFTAYSNSDGYTGDVVTIMGSKTLDLYFADEESDINAFRKIEMNGDETKIITEHEEEDILLTYSMQCMPYDY